MPTFMSMCMSFIARLPRTSLRGCFICGSGEVIEPEAIFSSTSMLACQKNI